MKKYFLIYLLISLSLTIIAMNNSNLNNYKSSINYILNNNFINDIKKYLTNGGNINHFNCNGETLLILAVKKSDLETVKFLLDNNALVNLLNHKMKSSLDYAKEIGNPQIIEILEQKYFQELGLLDLESNRTNFILLEHENVLDNSTNINNQNEPYNNLFNTMSNLVINEPYAFFNNLQNIESQANNENIELLNPQYNTNQPNTLLINQEQNNQINSTLTNNNFTKKWQCNFCSSFFTYKYNLTQHKKCVHALSKDWQCNQCQKKFSSKQYLRNHKKNVHSLNKDWQCNKCQKKFNSKQYLINHKKNAHSLNKSWQCNFCNYKTSIKNTLKQHINGLHTKKILYKCDYEGCNFKTFWPTSLEKHKKIKNH